MLPPAKNGFKRDFQDRYGYLDKELRIVIALATRVTRRGAWVFFAHDHKNLTTPFISGLIYVPALRIASRIFPESSRISLVCRVTWVNSWLRLSRACSSAW